MPHAFSQRLNRWRIQFEHVAYPVAMRRIRRRQVWIMIVNVDDDDLSQRTPVVHRRPDIRYDCISLEHQHIRAAQLSLYLRVTPV